MKAQIVDESSLPGLDEILSNQEGDISTDASLSQVEKALISTGYPIESTMGFGDNLKAIVDHLRGRHLLRELPEEIQSVTWLELHVPKNGTALLSSSEIAAKENAVEFALFGSGFGQGRKMKLTFEETSDERKDCVRYVVHVRVKPLVYQIKSDETIVLDVIGVVGEAIEPFLACPYCGIESDIIDRFENRLDPFLDLRKETVSHQRTFSLESIKDLTMKIGVTVPNLESSILNLTAKLSSTITWKVKYGFKPGLLYQPYWRLDGIPPHTPMWAIKA